MKNVWIVAASIVLLGLVMAAIFWNQRDINAIVDDGSFERSFRNMYPSKEKDIENWFRSNIPFGTPRGQVQKFLKSSFTIDLTTGRNVMIERTSGLSGGQSTEIYLKFDNDLFQNVEVHQFWVYL